MTARGSSSPAELATAKGAEDDRESIWSDWDWQRVWRGGRDGLRNQELCAHADGAAGGAYRPAGSKTAANNRQIHDVDERAQAGIKQAQGAADAANQNAQNASKAAGDAQIGGQQCRASRGLAGQRGEGAGQLQARWPNVTVTFGFDKAVLTKDDKDQLDDFAAQLGSAKSYILEVTGGTDSTGPAQYNYDLSQRRADAVVQYLAAKYGHCARTASI